MNDRNHRATMAREIIARYGGGTKFAQRLAEFTGHGHSETVEKLRNRAYKWNNIGVSPDWRGAVRRMLEVDGHPVPPGFDRPVTIPSREGEPQPGQEPRSAVA